MQDILTALTSLAALAAFITLVSEGVDKLGWHLDGTPSQVRSLFIALCFGEAGAGFHLGMFSDTTLFLTMPWYAVGGIVGIAAGVVANWSFSLPIVQWILTILKIRVPVTLQPEDKL